MCSSMERRQPAIQNVRTPAKPAEQIRFFDQVVRDQNVWSRRRRLNTELVPEWGGADTIWLDQGT